MSPTCCRQQASVDDAQGLYERPKLKRAHHLFLGAVHHPLAFPLYQVAQLGKAPREFVNIDVS
jgi:hypothetical protein